MVGADFEAVFEIQAVCIDAVVIDVDVEVDFGDTCFRADFADFCQQAGSVAFAAALRQGNDVVDVDNFSFLNLKLSPLVAEMPSDVKG